MLVGAVVVRQSVLLEQVEMEVEVQVVEARMVHPVLLTPEVAGVAQILE
jgi:hypothetical protein